jgi:hypothetical protein
MNGKSPAEDRYTYHDADGYEERLKRRLRQDMELDPSSAEVILHMRNQIRELQERIRQLEGELTVQHTLRRHRLSQYREIYIEATWIEIADEDEED